MNNDIIEYSYMHHTTRYPFTPFRPMYEMDGYDANGLIDSLKETYGFRNDIDLCRLLDVAPPTISKLRNARMSVSGDLLLRMHDKTGLSIAELRKRLGVA